MIVAIELNGVPLATDPPPIVAHGRVLLPARAVFAALGAAVDYNAATKRVLVRRGGRSASLTLGSRAATSNGRALDLDAPPYVAHGRTFVPLRFLAEALGDSVDYDGSRVAIADGPAPVASQADYLAPSVEYRRPEPGETVGAAFPSISAEILTHGGPAVDPASVRVFFDGRDVSDLAYKTAFAVSYSPEREIFAGEHEVTVQGADERGRRFTSNWTFQSSFAYPSGPNIYGVPGAAPFPAAYAPLPFSFYTTGPFPYTAGNVITIVLISPSGGTGYVNLCGYGRYPLTYGPQLNHYTAIVPLPVNAFAPACRVDGYFTDLAGNRTYLLAQHPLVFNTVPAPAPAPKATPLPATPPARRRPLARPSPLPSLLPSPSPSPHPAPSRTAHPKAVPTPARTPATAPTATPEPRASRAPASL